VNVVVAYHADDGALGALVFGIAVSCLLFAAVLVLVASRLRRDVDGRNRSARAALIVSAAAVVTLFLIPRLFPEDELSKVGGTWNAIYVATAIAGAVGVVVAIVLAAVGVARVRRDGERWLAVVALGAALAPLVLGVGAFAGCAVSDACFH
jgi:hypothetical protein